MLVGMRKVYLQNVADAEINEVRLPAAGYQPRPHLPGPGVDPLIG